MRPKNKFNNFSKIAILLASLTIAGCKSDNDDIPKKENDLEVITDVVLTFTNVADATDIVTAKAEDKDGAGINPLQIINPINLSVSKSYILTYEILNKVVTPNVNITEEIEEEAVDHQLFYSFTNNAFGSPTGDGNIDNPADPLTYNDFDKNGRKVGLLTTWTTSSTPLSGGKFKVKLQHQPGLKNSTSGSTDGDTDFELEFDLNITK